MEIKLIAFDLDGTFLNDRKEIIPENMTALQAAADRSIMIVPATGRIFSGLHAELRTAPYIRYYLTINGSYVYDRKEDAILRRAEISPELAIRFYDYAETLDVLYDCYQDNWGFMSASMLERAPQYVTNAGILELVKRLRTPVDDLREHIRQLGHPVQKLQLYLGDIPPLEKEALMRDLAQRFPELRITSSVNCNIEINSREASKGQALKGLCEAMGISMENVMAFGDGSNDMDMISTAGLGVAMENAEEELKSAAKYVTADNNSAGVAQAINKMLEGRL